ncbi:MAG: hypothetical protein QOH91_2462 [Mycobacterium sp.]|jgi:PPE-repeat protein|nr:hypothetical protein [Mycobacterium sp.]
MARAAAPYTAWLTAAASQSEAAASQAMAVVSAFDAAFEATVSPMAVSIYRAVTNALANANIFGLNFSASAQKEAEYAEMWAQDVGAMTGYHAGA